MTTGVLFVGHGTRRQHGVDEFLAFVAAVKRRMAPNQSLTAHAFLELQPPNIPTGIDSLVQLGATNIICIPLFLFSAGHMKEDIPAQLAVAQARHPLLSMQLQDSFGTESALIDVVLARYAVAQTSTLGKIGQPEQPKQSGILLLGRGNKDVEAQNAFYAVAQAVGKRVETPHATVGFLAGTGETMEAALDSLIGRGVQQIIILPYLWFSGWLTDTLPDRAAQWLEQKGLAQNGHIQVEIAHHLGLHPAFVDLVAERVRRIEAGA